MQFTILALATVASLASAQNEIPVGEQCTPGGTPCALGADCYSTNSGLITYCGNFQASCKSDEQCAFNTCNLEQGLCNGFLETSATASSGSAMMTATPSLPGAAPTSTVTAPAGSLPLGAECNPFAEQNQCKGDVQCWASNSMLIARCGNFNAACQSDDQCAYNTCGEFQLCNGFIASSDMTMKPTATAVASGYPVGNGTVMATGTAAHTGPAVPEFTGAASVDTVAKGVMAVVAGAVALAL